MNKRCFLVAQDAATAVLTEVRVAVVKRRAESKHRAEWKHRVESKHRVELSQAAASVRLVGANRPVASNRAAASWAIAATVLPAAWKQLVASNRPVVLILPAVASQLVAAMRVEAVVVAVAGMDCSAAVAGAGPTTWLPSELAGKGVDRCCDLGLGAAVAAEPATVVAANYTSTNGLAIRPHVVIRASEVAAATLVVPARMLVRKSKATSIAILLDVNKIGSTAASCVTRAAVGLTHRTTAEVATAKIAAPVAMPRIENHAGKLPLNQKRSLA